MRSPDSWHKAFFKRHCERFPRPDWPPVGNGFWEDWARKITKSGIREAEAHQASEEIFDEGLTPDFVDRHPAELETRVRKIWRERREAEAPQRPANPAADDSANWNDRAYSHWATVSDEDKAEWRAIVRSRALFVRSKSSQELLAIAWAYDPASVISPTPRDAPAVKRGPRQLFDPIEKVD